MTRVARALSASVLTVVVSAGLVAVGPPAGAEPAVDPTWSAVPGVSLSDVAVATDGRVYGADYAGARLLRYAADGSAGIAADLTPFQPAFLEPARDGAMLVASHLGSTIIRVAADGGTVRSALPAGWVTTALVAAADGSALVFGLGSRYAARVAPDGGVDPWFRDLGFTPLVIDAASTAAGEVYLADASTGVWMLAPDGTVGQVARDTASPPIGLTTGPGDSVYSLSTDGSVRQYRGLAVASVPFRADASLRPLGDFAIDTAGDVLLATADRGLVERTTGGRTVQLAGLRSIASTAAADGTVYAAIDAGRTLARIRTAASVPPVLSYPTVPAGVVGRPMSAVPTRVAADTATVTVTSGALPPGLALDPATGALSGTPTTAGGFPLTLTISGPGGRSSVDLVLRIRADRSGMY